MTKIGPEMHPDGALPVTTYRTPMTMGESQAVQAAQPTFASHRHSYPLGNSAALALMRVNQSPEGFGNCCARLETILRW